jgi:hypothetical protein
MKKIFTLIALSSMVCLALPAHAAKKVKPKPKPTQLELKVVQLELNQKKLILQQERDAKSMQELRLKIDALNSRLESCPTPYSYP